MTTHFEGNIRTKKLVRLKYFYDAPNPKWQPKTYMRSQRRIIAVRGVANLVEQVFWNEVISDGFCKTI